MYFYLLSIFAAFTLFLAPAACPAQNVGGALEQLVELFESKGTLSSSEAAAIRATLSEERKHLEEERRAIEERERAVEEREKRLEEMAGRPVDAVTADEGGPAREPLETFYRNGFCFSSRTKDLYSLCIGGLLQADYRYFEYQDVDPGKDRFDLRRVRLILSGKVLRYFDYKFEYEFQGAGNRRLLDAYAGAGMSPSLNVRAGQFKEPFGLEQSSRDKNLFFAERSMGYYLTPQRDVGVMAHGSLWDGAVNYAAGIFNGDGLDDATGGDVDSPEITGRVALFPLRFIQSPLTENLLVGGSFSHASIDRNNVQCEVKTAGMTTFFNVAASAKFNIIREAGDRSRLGAELAWAAGPFLATGEYFRVRYGDIVTSSSRFDLEMKDYYVALLWMITGERPGLDGATVGPVAPGKGVFEGGWGALGLAVRYDVFEADESAYDTVINAGDSVREATAYSVALNWFLNANCRFILDYTRTEFDRPLLIQRDSMKGTSLYSDREDVITARFQIGF